MIKIIEPGTKTVAECNRCGCKFSYEKEDIQSRPHKMHDGCAPSITKFPKLFEYYVLCPQCGKDLTVISIKMQRA
jgi:hypothetical protein